MAKTAFHLLMLTNEVKLKNECVYESSFLFNYGTNKGEMHYAFQIYEYISIHTL